MGLWDCVAGWDVCSMLGDVDKDPVCINSQRGKYYHEYSPPRKQINK